MKRYQVYLNPQSVHILDEVTHITPISRSELIRAAIDGAASQVGNLLAVIKPNGSRDYSWLDKIVGATTVKGKKRVKISEKIDELYYQ
mgnify:CR=1 FL=1